MEQIETKKIVQNANHNYQWFGIDYNMNIYRGCCHGCIYCDSRSSCYQIEDFDRVRVKKDCIQKLEQELAHKRKKGVIGIGAMSDTYNPFEKKYEITRKSLQVIEKYGFGISIDTKSDLITRDIDIFQKINQKAPVILKLTITTSNDELAKMIEQNVCDSSHRFAALKKIADAGIFTGVLLTPILPFITDTEKNIKEMVRLSYENGARFIVCLGGVTLRANQRTYYYDKLDEYFPGMKEKYIRLYGERYICQSQNKELENVFKNECKKYGLLYKMKDIINAYQYERKESEQISLFS